MPLSDKEYQEKYGYTRAEQEERKKERQKKYMKKYNRSKKGVKRKKKAVKRRKKIVIHNMELTRQDLETLEAIRTEAMELYRNGINSFLLGKQNA